MREQRREPWTAALVAALLVVWVPASLAAEQTEQQTSAADSEAASNDPQDDGSAGDLADSQNDPPNEADAPDTQDDEPSNSDGDGIPDDRDDCSALAEDDDDFRDEDGCPEEDDWTVRSMEWTVGAGTVVATAGLGLLIAGTVVRMRVRSQIQQGSSGEDATGRTVVDQEAITQREAYRRVNLGDDLRVAGALGFGLGTGVVAVTKLVAVLDDRKLFTAGDRWRLVPRVGRAHMGFSVELGMGGE